MTFGIGVGNRFKIGSISTLRYRLLIKAVKKPDDQAPEEEVSGHLLAHIMDCGQVIRLSVHALEEVHA